MRAHNVPEWYIDSCLKIKYMFPKAHAAAYVMMAWRIAYCKVFYPLAYYAAYFSIRATGFNYEIMCQGKERLEYFYKDYTRRKNSLSKKSRMSTVICELCRRCMREALISRQLIFTVHCRIVSRSSMETYAGVKYDRGYGRQCCNRGCGSSKRRKVLIQR